MARSSQHTRREFLAGQAARDAAASLVDRLDPSLSPTGGVAGGGLKIPAPQGTTAHDADYLLRFSRRAMACQFEWMIPAGHFERDTETALAALDLVDELEQQLTVYREDSEIMAINRLASHGPVPVEPALFQLLSLGVAISRQTGAAYDMTSGALSKVWGFYRREASLPPDDEIARALERVGSRHIEFDPQRQTIRFLRPGIELNLGSIGKGYALDRCGELFREAGIDRALLHGGQSSVLAIGAPATSSTDEGATGDVAHDESPNDRAHDSRPRAEDRGWLVGIGDPLRPGKRVALVRLEDRALGTSGSSVQFFRHGGKRYGHVLDPRTGWPAEGLLSATIIAPSAAEADAYSTAAYVLGLEGAIALCEQTGLAGIFIESSDAGTRLKIHTHGLGPGNFRRIEQNG